MESPRKETNQSETKLWMMEKSLEIPIWHKQLSLPNPDRHYTDVEIRLQQDLDFLMIPSAKEEDEEVNFLFISQKTRFYEFAQYFPFLFNNTRLYLCNDRLLAERISLLNQSIEFNRDDEVTQQLESVLEQACQVNASDIHIESLSTGRRVRLRILGKLMHFKTDGKLTERLISKIKLVSKMDISITRVPQDGHFPYLSSKGSRFDMRVSTIPGIYGEKVVIRLLPASTISFTMSDLGIPDVFVPKLRNVIHSRAGMIIVTGPTGSGKTTTLYAVLNELDTERLNIVTIENPVEYRLENITQIEVNELANLTFSSALRSILRQDPDVILIGEIRDSETAIIASRAAQTGHLVLSTLHSTTVFEAIQRLKNLGVDNDDIASSLKLIISQRLVNRLCTCQNDPDCRHCSGRGVLGRMPLMELLEIDKRLEEAISENSSIHELRKYSEENGFRTMASIGRELMERGLLDYSEFKAVCDWKTVDEKVAEP